MYYENRAFNIFKTVRKLTVKKKKKTLISSTLTHKSTATNVQPIAGVLN